jgi:hypothetical protein
LGNNGFPVLNGALIRPKRSLNFAPLGYGATTTAGTENGEFLLRANAQEEVRQYRVDTVEKLFTRG